MLRCYIFVFVKAGGVDPTFPYPAKELRMSFLEARSTLSIALESRAQDWSVEDLLQVERPLVSKELHFTLGRSGSWLRIIRQLGKYQAFMKHYGLAVCPNMRVFGA